MSITVQLGLLMFLFVSAMFFFGMNIYFYSMNRKRKLRREIQGRYFSQTSVDQSNYNHH